MDKVQLVIGNKNYSSWSFRAWLALRKSGANFNEVLLPLDTAQFKDTISDHSPTGRVPVLWDDGQCIWDSLAICEYVNDRFAQGRLWPQDLYSRGLGRAMVAEMHSGFPHLRNKLPMNCRAKNRLVDIDADLQTDLERVFALWSDSLACHADRGPWLLGDFSIADAMFAPVVLRLGTYIVNVPEDIQAYCDHLRSDPDVKLWIEDALSETWVVEADEAGTEQTGTE